MWDSLARLIAVLGAINNLLCIRSSKKSRLPTCPGHQYKVFHSLYFERVTYLKSSSPLEYLSHRAHRVAREHPLDVNFFGTIAVCQAFAPLLAAWPGVYRERHVAHGEQYVYGCGSPSLCRMCTKPKYASLSCHRPNGNYLNTVMLPAPSSSSICGITWLIRIYL